MEKKRTGNGQVTGSKDESNDFHHSNNTNTPTENSTPDTVYIYPPTPTQNDIFTAKDILLKLIEKKELSSLIRSTIQEMSAKELQEFQQKLNKEFHKMKNQTNLERARRKIQEFEAKKEKQTKRKETWKALTKEERRELIKDQVLVIAHDAGAATLYGVGAVGSIVGQGIAAIGMGILHDLQSIWHWLDQHFYLKIDLSCAEQHKIKRYQRHLKKNKPPKKYTGHCPNWP